ncbi:tetratricopeptide repeat protein [Amycolatopsis suaedae]|uniref:Tetratricopeptide repeat protein n=1 Tax=Amycolatopsis suaedae TaxID=2510978 RepID=A0A4Q7JCR8_9PSEU|nr:tetratricopeptide repeat protein [Amycolatopsis suaedae]RZQ64353.1 tetratricopeptide repeat protein [Amycolatopsis suaedae]
MNNEPQLRRIDEALRRGDQVVLLRGEPGVGATELAFQAVRRFGDRFGDGQFYVPLAGATGDAVFACLRELLRSVGCPREDIPHSADACASLFRSWSTGKDVVVVIDGATSLAQVRAFLPGAGRSAVLVTEAARLSGAALGATVVELDPLSDEAARELLTRLSGRTEGLDDLVRLCGGSTVALCAAAAVLEDWLVDRITRIGALRGLANDDVDPKAVLTAAYEQLPPEARPCYAALGRHPGPHAVPVRALAAALEVGEDEAEELADALVKRRLARRDDGRYVIGPLAREHAAEQDGDDYRARFSAFYLSHATRAAQAWQPRPWFRHLWNLTVRPDLTAEQARQWLTTERANLMALAGLLHDQGDPELCRLAVALFPLHDKDQLLDDMDLINDHAEQVAEANDLPAIRSLLLTQRGFGCRHRGEFDKAVELFERARAVAGDDRELLGSAVEGLGLSRREQGRIDEARAALRHNLELADEIGDPRRSAMARLHLGSVAEPELLADARRYFEDNGDAHNATKARMWQAIRAESVADLLAARDEFERLGYPADAVRCLLALARLTGDREYARAALDVAVKRGYQLLAEQARSLLD